MQETWLRSADGRLPLAVSSREAWLLTVLHHLCIDAWRRQGRQQAILEQRVAEDGVPALASQDNAPEHLTEQARRVEQALMHLIRTLPADDVAVVLLYEVFGFSHAELGALAGRSEAASRQQLHRMLHRLRRTAAVEQAVDDTGSCLLALCRLALVQRDPAGLIAALKAARPQAMAPSLEAAPAASTKTGRPASTRLVQLGNLLALLIQAENGHVSWLRLGEACAESVSL